MAIEGTRKEYLDASMERIRGFAKDFKETIGGFTATAIYCELKTMYDVGFEKGKTHENAQSNVPPT